MDWTECRDKGIVRQTTKNQALISNLVEAAEDKLHSSSLLPNNSRTRTSRIALTYDAIRALLEALAVSKGFKVYNHECFEAFLDYIMDAPQTASLFRKARILRNQITYFGSEVSEARVQNSLRELIIIKNEVRAFLAVKTG
ncbi:MAG: hypothetical protein ABIA93_00860 [Candidatus Woesearchaeota archaeon]